ncbi:hypothetical protein H5410_060458 [Solanum commersonii]|uniref:Uncharacterized protein n=1 Tax=Solanum commersonii TaxID=4109 RepID=A0A9J5W624_SOLCO|nr:hypothetical protein H5410_060458 [Solanum commersonii]
MGTFEKLGLKQVVKTTEETLTIDSDHQTFRLLTENDLASYREIYISMHICLVQVAFKPLTLRGLAENFIAALRDGRNQNWKKSLIGTIQTSLSYGPKLILVNLRLLPEDISSGTKLISHKNGLLKVQPTNINDEVLEIEHFNDETVKIKFSNPLVMHNRIDNHSMSSRLPRSNSSYISPVDYIVQALSRGSTSKIRENYRCDNMKIDKDNIARPMPGAVLT